ncbi:MAG: pilus assembly PilX N-terminal domain-containing protein [Pseudomonadota bacterium]
MTLRKQQNGAALVVGLMLLVVITVLAVSGMNTATTELAVARNDQNYENAFQAAETGLETALTQGNYDTSGTATVTKTITDNEKVSAEILYETTTSVPDKAFSLGLGTGISAYHFVATSTAESRRLPGSQTERDSTATHTQAFYIVGPSDSTL